MQLALSDSGIMHSEPSGHLLLKTFSLTVHLTENVGIARRLVCHIYVIVIFNRTSILVIRILRVSTAPRKQWINAIEGLSIRESDVYQDFLVSKPSWYTKGYHTVNEISDSNFYSIV